MFCTKCGYNAGTAKFCPKCGNPLNPQPVQETPVQNEPVAQTIQSEPVEQQQFGTQPQLMRQYSSSSEHSHSQGKFHQ